MVESIDHHEAWQKKKTEVQLLVIGKGPDILVQKEHNEIFPCPVEIDLVQDLGPRGAVRRAVRRNAFRIYTYP
jgi:hypothetical protein